MKSVSEFAHGLRNLPLVHGFLDWPMERSESIRQSGLVASGPGKRGVNSFDHDEILGRTDFVFLSTAKLQPDYTFGFDCFALVDPHVMLLHGVDFSVVDISQIMDQIDWVLRNDARKRPDWLQDPENFDGIIESEAQSAREAYARERGLDEVPTHVPKRYVIPRICASEPFRRHLRSYSLPEDQFFATIARTAAAHKWGIEGYLERDRLWTLREEILVPGGVTSDLLLGFWDGHDWHKWNNAKSSAAAEGLDRFLAAKQALKERRGMEL